MKVGDLVRSPDGHIGIVEKVEPQFFGATQSFKRLRTPRGQCIDSRIPDIIGPTVNGISDRVLVVWPSGCFISYENSINLEVITHDE